MNRRELLVGVTASAITAIACTGGSVAAQARPAAVNDGLRPRGRQTLSLNRGWRFHEGDIPFPKVTGHGWTYANAKAGNAQGAAAPEFDDTDWRPDVTLPHDFVIEQPLTSDANPSQGYRRRGIAWYRNLLKFDEADRGKAIELQFDGIGTQASVWFNGTLLAHNWSGYNSIYLDLTPYATYGDHYNSLVVRVDADAMQGWWYEGGGIYRNAWIVKREPTYIVTDGVFAHPRRAADGWTLPVEVSLRTIADRDKTVDVTVDVVDPRGTHVARGTAVAMVAPLDQAVVKMSIPISDPLIWSPDHPQLYSVTTRLVQDGAVIDEVETTCGFRTQRFDADHGFFLNDTPVKLKGVCLHQDHAGVGVAVPAALWDYRLRRLKDLGCNAIRCAHNAPAREFLDACDRQGFLVMDENRVFNPSPEHMAELEWMVRRDRNHPSVILWSVFNEEPMQGTEAGYEMVRRMRHAVRALDMSRPVTGAMNDGLFTPVNVSQALDVVGFNYQQGSYDAFHKANPSIPLTSSEDTSSYSVRGEYRTDDKRHVKGGFDTEPTAWGETHRAAWKAIAEREYIAGGFVWTGFDYRGEPTPYEWPTNASLFGIMDSCGFAKVPFYIHQAQWTDDRPIVNIACHWNWDGREGQAVRVMVCANTEEVELRLNGRLVGRQKTDRYEMNFFDVPFVPGKLEAIGYVGGKGGKHAIVETAGPAVALRLTPDRAALRSDGIDAMPIEVAAVDAKGRVVPGAMTLVHFQSDGVAILGAGNGDPNSLEADKADRRSLFHGLAQLIVQSDDSRTGKAVVTASADGLKTATATIALTLAKPVSYQATVRPIQALENWFMAPVSDSPPDPMSRPGAGDNNSWQWFRAGVLLPPSATRGFALAAVSFSPYHKVQSGGGIVRFLGITGRAKIYIDGSFAATHDGAGGGIDVRLPPKPGERRLAVVFDLEPGAPFGFGNTIQVMEA